MDPPQHGAAAIGVHELGIGGRGPWLARRVVCDQGVDYGRHRARRCRKQQSQAWTVLSELRNHQGAHGDSQRLRGLADSHGQPPLMRRKPPRHHAAAGGIAAGRRHPAQERQRSHRHQRVNRCRGEGADRGQRGAGREHPTFSDAVRHITPGDQRDHHAQARHCRQQTPFGQRGAARSFQCGNHERNGVDKAERTGGYRQRNSDDRSAQRRADRLRGHQAMLAQMSLVVCLLLSSNFPGINGLVRTSGQPGPARSARLRRARDRR